MVLRRGRVPAGRSSAFLLALPELHDALGPDPAAALGVAGSAITSGLAASWLPGWLLAVDPAAVLDASASTASGAAPDAANAAAATAAAAAAAAALSSEAFEEAAFDSMGRDLLMFLGATSAVVPLCRALGASPVLGFLAAGVVLGPAGFGLFSDLSIDNKVRGRASLYFFLSPYSLLYLCYHMPYSGRY